MSTENGYTKCAVCSIESKLKCSNCVNVFYCSVAHQRDHWKTHKTQCFPIQIRTNELFGRYLIASRDIKPGEIVLKESPIISGPSQITPPVCVGCLQGLRQGLHEECDRCGWPICTKDCQKNILHKSECDLTVSRGEAGKVSFKQFFSPHPTYQCVTTLRCLMLKENKVESWNKLIELESHCDQRRGSVLWLNDREGVAKFIQRFFKCNKWSEDEILKVAGIVQINGHEVPLTDPPHVSIYYFASFLEHSCSANLTKTFTSKGEITLWTDRHIKKGENLSICYTDILWGTASRQHHLLQTKLFNCNCTRCADVTELGTYYSAVKCNSKGCDGLLLPESLAKWEDNWSCNKSNHIVEYKYVAKIIDRAGKDLNAMEKGKEEHCIKYIEHYGQWLPSQHFYICDVKIALTQIIGAGGPEMLQNISEDRLLLKIQLCQELLKIYKVIAAAETRHLGALHFELHAGLAEWGRRGAQQLNNSFKGAFEESLFNAEEVVRLLEKEPSILPEGKICEQAKINAESLRVLLGSTTSIDL